MRHLQEDFQQMLYHGLQVQSLQQHPLSKNAAIKSSTDSLQHHYIASFRRTNERIMHHIFKTGLHFITMIKTPFPCIIRSVLQNSASAILTPPSPEQAHDNGCSVFSNRFPLHCPNCRINLLNLLGGFNIGALYSG